MGYFGGFLVTMRQHGARNKVTTEYSGGRVFRRKNNDVKDEKTDFDLILSDIQLSDGNCFEIFEKTKPLAAS